MTSFAYIYPCPFTLLHLLPTNFCRSVCQANLRVYLSLLWLYFISLFIYFWMANKKNKIRNKRKNGRNQYTCTKRTVLSEENNDTTATAELS